ncbi:hypothetical protein FI667_g721, partial [Globisporangium splendens]
MVGFLRKKKSDKVLLSYETALDRKGKVDGASLLDDNGDPTSGSLYDMRAVPGARRNSNQENNVAANNNTYPPPYPQQFGSAFPPQQSHVQPPSSYPAPPVMQTGFGNPSFAPNSMNNNNNASYPRKYGAHVQQPQYPQQYGAHQQYAMQQQQPYGAPQQYGNQPQYPIQYGHYPPPMQPEAPKKSSFFRIPSIGGKKN